MRALVNLILLLFAISTALPVLHGQRAVTFRTGQFALYPAVAGERSVVQTKYLFYQADHVLSTAEISELEAGGIKLLYALQDHLYWVRVQGYQEEAVSSRLFEISPGYKLGIDESERSTDNSYRVSIARGLTAAEISQWAEANQINILDDRAVKFGVLDVQLPSSTVDILLHTPWISFIQNIPVDEAVNFRALPGERGWALISPLERGLTGAGMVIGIGDGGRVEVHEDISRDYLDLASFGTATHPTQVSGIVTGAGLIDPYYGFGYAPQAHIILRNFSDILWDAPRYIQDFGLTLTNNSYGSSLTDCTYFGDYDASSAGLDAMVMENPTLLHVFSSANSGGMTCSPFPNSYATIAGGYQPAKNLLTVGAVNVEDAIASFSSRGPVDDGRIKPEIVANGAARYTTIGTNNYASNSGTSFSSPATMGIATLLYERYKQLHTDSVPDAALIKNALCNAADDFGNIGPDFIYGFGRINGDRAARILEDNHFLSVNVNQGNVLTRTITIPSNTASADVMIMWTDEPSAPYETVTLVNDLDFIVVTPAGDTLKPWILNCTPAGVSAAATTGYDRFNNVEQVTLNSPVPGTYTLVIKGYNVPFGPQKAWITWDIQTSGVEVQSPNGGEVFKPGDASVPLEKQYIRWDAFGTGSSTFSVDYSTNGGGNWTNIANAVAANRRFQEWFPPNAPSDQVKVRVTASNSMQDVSDQNAVILFPPYNLVVTSPCNGNLSASWSAIAGAAYYKIFMIKNERLYYFDSSLTTTKVLHGFPVDSAIWISVAGAFSSGTPGMRSRAVSVTANGGSNCTWPNDLKLDSIVNLRSGRRFTSTALSNTEVITVHISNLGTTNASGFTLNYKINNEAPVNQNFPGTINAGTNQNFYFTKTADLSAPGTYNIVVWTTFASDPFHENDTLKIKVTQLDNGIVTLPWSTDFELLPDTSVIKSLVGLPHGENIDLYVQPGARIRTFAGNNFCNSGNRALTMDAIRTGASKNDQFVITLNLANYHVASDDIRLSFRVMQHEIILDGTNTEAVWVRGADTLPFVQLVTIPNDAAGRGVYQYLAGLKISQVLSNAGQEFSASFQIRFNADVYATAGQVNSQDGQTIDDITIQKVSKDLAVTGIISPVATSCELGTESIIVALTNTSSMTVNNASVSYRVNGGSIQTTAVGSVAPNTTTNISLNPAYNFSASGLYNIEAWCSSPDDQLNSNDTARTPVLKSQLISSFPYVEGFESGTGNFLSGGINSTWARGIPGKAVISRAAEGKYVWTTALTGTHNADELSYLYSPCFDLTGLAQPYLSFASQYQLESGFDYVWVEYRLSGSNTWTKLGTQGSGINWYSESGNRWNGNRFNWLTTGYPLPVLDTTIQFRWVMSSDVGVEYDGFAIDQVTVYDRLAIYNGSNTQITQAVSGNNWIDFNSGGQRIFSINPMGQNLGNVTLNIYKSGGNYFTTDSVYLMSRNWVLSSTNTPSAAIKMRGYFTQTEANNLIGATGCSQCISARDGFDVAALRYTGANQDGSYANNTSTQVTAYLPDSTLIVPFDNGFFAEWSTPGMSEWWITPAVTKWAGNVQVKISGSNDDAEEHEFNGSVNPFDDQLWLTEKEGKQFLGWRFKFVTIPKNSYITSAHLEWTAAAINSTLSNWTLQSELSTISAAFTPSKYNISLRSRSSQVVQWQPAAWNSMNTTYSSPEIRHLIQQVVDQSGWVTGKNLSLLMKGDGLRRAWSYDGDALKGAKLVVTYKSICDDVGKCYVDKNAVGQQTGNTWADAYPTLEQALDRAAHCPDVDEIWIADGTYRPYYEVARTAGYAIRPGVKLYGGFQGNETSIDQRIYGAFPTILSGDIGTIGVASDNVYHVLTTLAGGEETLIDGVTIKEGMANGGTSDLQWGSAIYNLGNLKCKKVTVQANSAPAVYNGPGAQLNSVEPVEVKQ